MRPVKRPILLLVAVLTITSCEPPAGNTTIASKAPGLTVEQASRLAHLPMKCISQEYPNKLSQTIIGPEELQSPKTLHPSFYGCFDWHSSVHGHWVLAKLLNDFPDLPNRAEIQSKLVESLSADNIQKEAEYFSKKHERSYERTYGWSWYLKLVDEIQRSKISEVAQLSSNLGPLTDVIVQRYIDFLPKLNYPIRTGVHPNSAFGMTFAFDYATAHGKPDLADSIRTAAKRLYSKDRDCPISWEPSGADFLSPCFEELNLMRRVLSKEEFSDWGHNFLPQLERKDFDLAVGEVSDRTDGQMVHLDGLNFSRAWVLYGLAKQYPEKYGHLVAVADTHLNYSLPSITDSNYEGEHWLASFAVYALSEK
ncbi:MAG TPA: DUF2891 domain-containing protein [Pyrinomonadaceae bacterium]|nr:DUF2891 domain-containing protein [Pyrinomonadaceae bacterium]